MGLAAFLLVCLIARAFDGLMRSPNTSVAGESKGFGWIGRWGRDGFCLELVG